MSDALVTEHGEPLVARLNVADELAVLIIGESEHFIDAGTARQLADELSACADALDALADDGL